MSERKLLLQRFRLNDDDKAYLPGDGLLDALEIAIALNKPLLITGDPGTGKTRLASWLAATLAGEKNGGELFAAEPFVFNTKSTSQAIDLFYNYDAVSHFGKIQRLPKKEYDQLEDARITREFIELKAMGLAIAQTYGIANKELAGIRNYISTADDGPVGPKPMSSVVLIDEIDKAPREFSNDLLNELEKYKFDVKELNLTVAAAKNNKCRIIIILTSNDEKTLPNAFLRRCIFYHIAFPEKDMLLRIAKLKLGIDDDNESYDPALKEAIAYFEELRDKVLIKKPSTAELLDWLNMLYHSRSADGADLLKDEKGNLHPDAKNKKNLGILIKTNPDMEGAI